MKLTLLLLVLAVPAFAQNQPDEKLCSVETVFIDGRGREVDWLRKNLEKKTWLRIENVKPSADAVLTVRSGAFTPVNAILSRRDPEEFLWDGSGGNKGPFSFKLPVARLIDKLNKVANCK